MFDGPFPYPESDKLMKVVDADPANYKGGSGAKMMPQTTTSRPTTKMLPKLKKAGIMQSDREPLRRAQAVLVSPLRIIAPTT
jgi:hypothetical protein